MIETTLALIFSFSHEVVSARGFMQSWAMFITVQSASCNQTSSIFSELGSGFLGSLLNRIHLISVRTQVGWSWIERVIAVLHPCFPWWRAGTVRVFLKARSGHMTVIVFPWFPWRMFAWALRSCESTDWWIHLVLSVTPRLYISGTIQTWAQKSITAIINFPPTSPCFLYP